MSKKIDRTGEIEYNNYKNKMTIIEYKDCDNLIVKFEDGYITNTTYRNFKNKKVKSPYDKSVFGVGYLGEGIYKPTINNIKTKVYIVWGNMMQRCYDENFQKKHTSYKHCTVCLEWHNFQNFAEWYTNNYYEIESQQMHLDKDILHKGNKIYSPSTCMIVPQCINELFVKCDKSRGNYPIGVCYNKKSGNYMSKLNIINNNVSEQKYLGYYTSIYEAFNVYKKEKEMIFNYFANKYKEYIPSILYNALINYKIEITD